MVGEALPIVQASNHSSFHYQTHHNRTPGQWASDKAVFDDPHGYASMASEVFLIPRYSSFDRRAHSLTWTIRQPNYEADRRGEFHPSRQTQEQSGGTDVFEQAIETKRMIIDVDAPNSRWQRVSRAWLGPAFSEHRWARKHRVRQRKMRIENVVSSLLTGHGSIISSQLVF
jgi:hypothetical protein